jgi:hypothetical protein
MVDCEAALPGVPMPIPLPPLPRSPVPAASVPMKLPWITVPVAAAPVEVVVAWLRERGLRILATRVDAPTLHVDADLRGPVALVLGSEADGLSPAWDGVGVERLRLPMEGIADSLNVSAAAAILLYEAWRQRRHAPDAVATPQSG